MTFAIRAEEVSKRYRIGERARYGRFTESVASFVRRPFRRKTEGDEAIWALRDVSFEIAAGEVVGIIGRNGAGKSTLLKILSRVTQPTSGRALVGGRIGSLLEVGMGFHPELTGRENVILSGAVLGMRRREVLRKFDEIVAFAEVGDLLDTPVKRYSSGMEVRLAFSVAAHLDTEIIAVDEVLAVGDIGFQRRCLERMGEIARSGRTVLVVSHAMASIESVCSRVLVLHRGSLVADGAPEHAIARYLTSIADEEVDPTRQERSGDGLVRVERIDWEDGGGRPRDCLVAGEPFDLVLHFSRSEPMDGELLVSFALKDTFGRHVVLHQTDFTDSNFRDVPEQGRIRFHMDRLPLTEGEYSLTVYLGNGTTAHDVWERAARVRVARGDFYGTGHPGRPGVTDVLIDGSWSIE